MKERSTKIPACLVYPGDNTVRRSASHGKPIAIIGAGNGGQAFAAYLSLHGHKVRIFDVVQETVDELSRLGGIELTGTALAGLTLPARISARS